MGLLCSWNSVGNNTGLGCHFLLQGIFPTQGSNVGLPHFRQILYHLSHQGSPNSIFKKDCKYRGFPGGSVGKESICNAGDLGSISGLGRSSGGGHGNPLQYSCLENPHGQRSLVNYSPWGHKKSDTNEQLNEQLHVWRLSEKAAM